MDQTIRSYDTTYERVGMTRPPWPAAELRCPVTPELSRAMPLFFLYFVAKLALIRTELRRGKLHTILLSLCRRGDVTLGSFLSLFRIIQQYLCACSSSGIVWVETMASPPAAGGVRPPILFTVFPDEGTSSCLTIYYVLWQI